MNYSSVLNKASKLLTTSSIKNFKLDSEIILSNMLNLSREELLLNLNKKISNKDLKCFNKLIYRRKKKRTSSLHNWI